MSCGEPVKPVGLPLKLNPLYGVSMSPEYLNHFVAVRSLLLLAGFTFVGTGVLDSRSVVSGDDHLGQRGVIASGFFVHLC